MVTSHAESFHGFCTHLCTVEIGVFCVLLENLRQNGVQALPFLHLKGGSAIQWSAEPWDAFTK